MANKRTWNFNCPQYVDFVAGIDNNPDDVYFDCKGLPSPIDGEACKKSRAPVKNLMDEVENRLVNKMTAALSVIGNTPKLKMGMVRGKLFSEKTPLKNVASQLVKRGKPDAVSVRPSRMRSKSVCVRTDDINKAREFKPKRSSSLSDLRIVKKHTYAKTPLCLKRTLKSKAKPKTLKTTEEMELEQIAILQKQLTQLLRNNEISYKRLIQRQKPCAQKKTETKPDNSKGNAAMNTNKNTRRNFLTMNHTAMKTEALKLDSIISNKGASNKAANIPKDVLEKSNIPSVSSSIVSDDCDKIKASSSKKAVKYGFHSGLVFHDNAKKNTIVKPFSFDVKIKERNTRNAASEQKTEVSRNGKENIPIRNPKSVVKRPMDKQNIKNDMKILGSNKKIVGQSNGNPVRGLPLAENSVRN